MMFPTSVAHLGSKMLYIYMFRQLIWPTSAKHCPVLENTPDGHFDHSACHPTGRYHGDTCSLICDDGFAVKGSSTVTCDNGKWRNTIGECTG